MHLGQTGSLGGGRGRSLRLLGWRRTRLCPLSLFLVGSHALFQPEHLAHSSGGESKWATPVGGECTSERERDKDADRDENTDAERIEGEQEKLRSKVGKWANRQMAPEQDYKAQVGEQGGRSLLPILGSYAQAGHLGQVLHSSPEWYQQVGSLPEPVPQRGHLPVHGFCRLSDVLQLPLQTPPASLCPRCFLLCLLQLSLELLQPEVAFLQLSGDGPGHSCGVPGASHPALLTPASTLPQSLLCIARVILEWDNCGNLLRPLVMATKYAEDRWVLSNNEGHKGQRVPDPPSEISCYTPPLPHCLWSLECKII